MFTVPGEVVLIVFLLSLALFLVVLVMPDASRSVLLLLQSKVRLVYYRLRLKGQIKRAILEDDIRDKLRRL